MKPYILLLLLIGGLLGCQREPKDPWERYREALAKAQSSQERNDKIFMNFQFGMRPKAFFDYCTELNRQRVITEGHSGSFVKYQMEEQLDYPASMHFFPEFTPAEGPEKPVIYAMDLEFQYDAWAPWNGELQAENLLRDVTELFVEWYGDDFFVVPDESLGPVVVQFDHNRRITLWRMNSSTVRGRMVDLSRMPDDPILPGQLELPTFRQDSTSGWSKL